MINAEETNIHYFGKEYPTKEHIVNYVHDVLTANDEMSPENNERFKFNDRKEGRGSGVTGGAGQSDIGKREVASGTECIGLIGTAITHPCVKPTPRTTCNPRVQSPRARRGAPGVVYRSRIAFDRSSRKRS